MSERTPCSALINDACKNGFYVTAVCHGIGVEDVAPTCMNEERCAHLYAANDGVPIVITRAVRQQDANS